MALVLIVEDEPTLRGSMARGLSRLPGVEIVEAGTLGAALKLIDATPPRLVLSDIDLPDRSGIEILGELGKRGLRVPVVFISAYLKAYGPQIPPHADVDVRDKPVSLEELRKLVLERLGQQRGETEAAPFTAADYLQLACLGQRSVVIEVGTEGGRGSGRILVRGGEVWSAEDADGSGEAAFRRLVLVPGAVRCQTLKGEAGERNVHGGWEALLLDAAREEDEQRRTGREPEREAEPPADAAQVAFDVAWERGVAALLAKDYAQALNAFMEARRLRPGDGRVIANLERLRQMGHGDGAA
jgi:CheY-like chemotaxis protein